MIFAKHSNSVGASSIPRSTSLLTLLLVTLMIVPQLASSINSSTCGPDWTSFTCDFSNTRYNAESKITASNVNRLIQKWFFETDHSVTSTPIVSNGKVYFADWAANVYSVNIADGSLNWRVNVGPPTTSVQAISSTPAVANGLVYVAGGPFGTPSAPEHEVIALDQTDGHIVWTHDIHTSVKEATSIWASPIVYNGLVYVGVAGQDVKIVGEIGEIDALNAITGAKVWNFTTGIGTAAGAPVWGSVVVDPTLNAIYFGTGNVFDNHLSKDTNSLYAYSIMDLDATTGKLNWFFQVYHNHLAGDDNDFGSTPNLFDLKIGSVVYQAVGLGGKDGKYYVIDRTNGHSLVNRSMNSATTFVTESGIIGLAGFIYSDGVPSNGNPQIFIPSTFRNSSTGKTHGLITAFNPSSNSTSWTFTAKGHVDGSVVIVPGAILFGDRKGFLYAISTADGHQLKKIDLPFGQIGGGVTVSERFVLVGNFVKNVFATDPRLGVYAFAPRQ